MTLIAALLLTGWAATVAALFMLTHKHEHRIDRLLAFHAAERGTPNPDTTALIAFAERMAQRVQAPEQAVLEHALQQSELAPHPAAIQPDDDLGYWAKVFNETKEELADRLAEEEVTVGS